MSQIGTMKVMTGGKAKDVRVYSLDDNNVGYKGVRVQTPKGIGCLNFVTSGGDIPGVRVQTPSGVRHLKSYSYSENVDIVKTYDSPVMWSYGTDTIIDNGTTWTVGSVTFLLFGKLRMINGVVKFRLTSSNSNSVNFLNRRFYFYYHDGTSWIRSSSYVVPTELDTYYSVFVTLPSEVIVGESEFRISFICSTYASGTYSANTVCDYFQYKEQTTVYY